jgi:hypothetical protein
MIVKCVFMYFSMIMALASDFARSWQSPGTLSQLQHEAARDGVTIAPALLLHEFTIKRFISRVYKANKHRRPLTSSSRFEYQNGQAKKHGSPLTRSAYVQMKNITKRHRNHPERLATPQSRQQRSERKYISYVMGIKYQ